MKGKAAFAIGVETETAVPSPGDPLPTTPDPSRGLPGRSLPRRCCGLGRTRVTPLPPAPHSLPGPRPRAQRPPRRSPAAHPHPRRHQVGRRHRAGLLRRRAAASCLPSTPRLLPSPAAALRSRARSATSSSTLERDIRQRLGRYNAAGQIMARMCEEYRQVVDLLVHRGTPPFAAISERLYGSVPDSFHAGDPNLADLRPHDGRHRWTTCRTTAASAAMSRALDAAASGARPVGAPGAATSAIQRPCACGCPTASWPTRRPAATTSRSAATPASRCATCACWKSTRAGSTWARRSTASTSRSARSWARGRRRPR